MSSVEQAVEMARREIYTCKRKGNQQQLASVALNPQCYSKLKAALEEGTDLVSKRIKVIKLADKSDSDDEKRMYRGERTAREEV